MTIHYDPFLYVPNTFTPDDDEFNRNFQAIGGNIQEFEMYIYNRWGELVYTMLSMEDFWDGTYGGIMAQDGTYVWKAIIMDFNDIRSVHTGHVNLLR